MFINKKYFKPYQQQALHHRQDSQTYFYRQPKQREDLTRSKRREQWHDEQEDGYKFRSKSGQKEERRQKGVDEPIWDYLYNQGRIFQQQMLMRHENGKYKIDTECTFQPIIRHNKRYLANSNSTFLERAQVWQQNKIEKMVKEKQQEVHNDLKQCTFAPTINMKSRQILQDGKIQKTPVKVNVKNKISNPYYSPLKQSTKAQQFRKYEPLSSKKKSGTKIQMDKAKQFIRIELKRMAL